MNKYLYYIVSLKIIYKNYYFNLLFNYLSNKNTKKYIKQIFNFNVNLY